MIKYLTILLLALRLNAAQSFTVQPCATNSLTLLFVGDGFTSSEQGNFLRWVTNATASINGQTWVAGWSSRIKVLALATNSLQSGVTATAPNNDTPLGGYISGGVSLRQDVAKLDAVISGSPFAFESYYPITVLNMSTDRGTTLNGRLVVSTNSNYNILNHELGHLVAQLDDEYTGGGASTSSTNIASSATVGTNKWGRLIPPLGTPVAVDRYFVPSSSCKMGSPISQQFCIVCSNEFNRRFFLAAGISNLTTTTAKTTRTGTLRIR